MSRGLFQPLSNEGMNAIAGLSLRIQAPATPAWSQHKAWMAMHKSPTTPERDGANKGAPSPNGSIQAGERQMPPAKTMYCWKRLYYSSFWILVLQQGGWLRNPHGKDHQNNHKGQWPSEEFISGRQPRWKNKMAKQLSNGIDSSEKQTIPHSKLFRREATNIKDTNSMLPLQSSWKISGEIDRQIDR